MQEKILKKSSTTRLRGLQFFCLENSHVENLGDDNIFVANYEVSLDRGMIVINKGCSVVTCIGISRRLVLLSLDQHNNIIILYSTTGCHRL